MGQTQGRNVALKARYFNPWVPLACLVGLSTQVSCGPSAATLPLQGAQYNLPAVKGRTVVVRFSAPSSGTSATPAWVCMKNFPAEQGACQGLRVIEGGSQRTGPFNAMCGSKNLGGQLVQNTEVQLSCRVRSGEEPCFPQASQSSQSSQGSAPASSALKFKVTDAVVSLDRTGTSLLKGEGDTFLWSFSEGTECEAALAAAQDWRNKLVPKLGKCNLSSAVKEVLAQSQEAAPQQGAPRASLPLALTSAAAARVPPRSSCFDKPASARAACLLGSSAMEIYDLGSDVRAIDEVKQGRRTPRLCVFKAPEPQEAGKVAIHHVISGMETGARVALAKVGSLELTGGAIRYVFRDFVSVPDRPFLSIGSVLGTLYPVGEAHATSGVWQMDLGKAVRFVPQQWCAESYLSVNLPVSAGADKPQSGSAGGAPPGGSAGPNPPSPSSPGAGTSADTNRCE